MKTKFGVAADFDKLNDVVKAGYDFIEPSLNSVAKGNEPSGWEDSWNGDSSFVLGYKE